VPGTSITSGTFGQASPRTRAIATVVASLASFMTQKPRIDIRSADTPTMKSVKRSWYLLLSKRFFQLRL